MIARAAEKFSDEVFDLWGCPEQVEAHMESEGFSETEIDEQLQRLGFNRVYCREFFTD
jgi:hypothetical protein